MEGFAAAFLLIWIFGGILSLLGTIFWIWMLIDCATREPDKGNDKLVWILVIALTHLIGAAIYFFVRRPQRLREFGR